MGELNNFLKGGYFALGVIFGAIVGIAFVLVVSQKPFSVFEDETLLGAIIGGTLAGVASFLVAILAMLEARSRKAEESLDKDRAAAHSIYQKLLIAIDHGVKCRRHFMTNDGSVLRLGHDRVWVPMEAIAPLPDITIDEKSLLLRWRRPKILTEIGDLMAGAHALTGLTVKYEQEFREKIDPLWRDPSVVVSGRRVMGKFTVPMTDIFRFTDLRSAILSIGHEAQFSWQEAMQEFLDEVEKRLGEKVTVTYDSSNSGSILFTAPMKA